VSGESGLFRSDDAGASWLPIDDDAHRFGSINHLTGDPRQYGRVYLGTGGRGIVVGDLR
jgi:xyloglucan-specific exo-beta-1,4-glucanase